MRHDRGLARRRIFLIESDFGKGRTFLHIFLHDYAGHPFQVSLTRALATRGHRVTHAYFSGDRGPKGEFVNRPNDIGTVDFVGIGIKGEYSKMSFVSRRFKDVEYGANVAARIAACRPDIVLSGNAPTEAQEGILNAARRTNAAFVHWVQDFYSIAASRLLTKKLGPLGAAVGRYYGWLERTQFRRSDAIVLITDDFRALAEKWAGVSEKIFTVENWGMLDEIRPTQKANEWAGEHGLADKFVFLYSGTLALKHNPDLLLALARFWKDQDAVRVVVVGQGVGFDGLCAVKSAERIENLVLLPLQPVNRLSNVLGTSDVLVAVVEPDAGMFSVPSKVQSYLCAGRPILLAAPTANLAARILTRERAGIVAAPDDQTDFLRGAKMLWEDENLRAELSRNGAAYAHGAYAIDSVADKFLKIFEYALNGRAKY